MSTENTNKQWWHNLPAKRLEACTPSDSVDVGSWVRGLLVITDGNLRVRARGTSAANTPAAFAVVAGQIIPVYPKYVMAATTAVVLKMGA